MLLKRIILSSTIALCSMNAIAQGNTIAQGDVTVYSPGVTADGVTYYLPKTSLIVTVKVKKTTYTPGEFCRYAERYLRINDVANQHDEYWEVMDVNIDSHGVPDPNCLYTIKFGNKVMKPSVELTSDGIISAINTQKENLIDVQTDSSENKKEAKTERLNPQDYLTEEILLAGSNAKMAELTAKEIYDIRESKNTITRGQSENMPKDGESLKYILNLLDKQEQALMQLFTGETITEEYTYTINIDPSNESNRQVLMRFSRKLGVLSPDNLAGSPINIEIEDLHYIPKSEIGANNEIVKSKSIISKLSKSAAYSMLYYRVPGRANVKVIDNNKCYVEKNIQIAQFGNTEILSSTLFPKGASTKIIFDTESGNIISIKE